MNIKKDQLQKYFDYEATSMIAGSIFEGSWSYSSFLATKPSAKAKKDVDNWLLRRLAFPGTQGKIIPGFNDKPETEQ